MTNKKLSRVCFGDSVTFKDAYNGQVSAGIVRCSHHHDREYHRVWSVVVTALPDGSAPEKRCEVSCTHGEIESVIPFKKWFIRFADNSLIPLNEKMELLYAIGLNDELEAKLETWVLSVHFKAGWRKQLSSLAMPFTLRRF